MTTTVLVAHGSLALAEALSAVVASEPGLEAVATATDPAGALTDVGRIRPDAVLADLGEGDWVVAVIALTKAYPQIRVVGLAPAEAAATDRLLAAGVHLVDAASAGMGAVLAALHAGGGRRADEPGGSARAASGTQPTRSSALAPTDLQLLRLVAAGLDSESAARELGTDAGLVRRRLRRICTELRVESPIQAVAVALREGVLDLGSGP
ncbi:hypothetical protein GA707_04395 [Nostocoides sp. F2B08]|uniref:response regulator transcription factor n=1 Tax=Nostocoides sp. F2B08 TaxID=2653936 RepID=UPI0012638343|nr:response regulator transcription factor [Tetrasphaera sp. F2B08]KAB7745204.1 hypothetical protein GA707_04395 [Tetrasphaera sp. F2B08]